MKKVSTVVQKSFSEKFNKKKVKVIPSIYKRPQAAFFLGERDVGYMCGHHAIKEHVPFLREISYNSRFSSKDGVGNDISFSQDKDPYYGGAAPTHGIELHYTGGNVEPADTHKSPNCHLLSVCR